MADIKTPWIGTSQYLKQNRRGLPEEKLIPETILETKIDQKHLVCQCGHYYFLHDMLNGECNACDSPEVKVKDKCQSFKERK